LRDPERILLDGPPELLAASLFPEKFTSFETAQLPTAELLETDPFLD
jgi:hypothetical protein